RLSPGAATVAGSACLPDRSLTQSRSQRSAVSGLDVDGGPHALSRRRHRGPVYPPLGDRVGVSRDETVHAGEPADAEKQKAGHGPARAVGNTPGVQPIALPDGTDG